MKHTDFNKQIIEWNKTLVNSTVNFLERFQDHGEKVAGSYLALSPWGAEESKKALDQWSDFRKKSLKAVKEGVAFGFKQAEGFCASAQSAK